MLLLMQFGEGRKKETTYFGTLCIKVLIFALSNGCHQVRQTPLTFRPQNVGFKVTVKKTVFTGTRTGVPGTSRDVPNRSRGRALGGIPLLQVKFKAHRGSCAVHRSRWGLTPPG